MYSIIFLISSLIFYVILPNSLFLGEPICWEIHSSYSGGKGVNYQFIDNELNGTIFLENFGWIGNGEAKICTGNDGMIEYSTKHNGQFF